MLRFGQEHQLQLLWVLSLLIAGSNGVDHSDSRLVYRTKQVIRSPETTASLASQRLKSHARVGVGEITEGAPTLVTGKKHDNPPGSQNHPIMSSSINVDP